MADERSKMLRFHFSLAVFVASLALAGCGSDEQASAPRDPVAKSSPSARVAPMRVGVTEARVGDATTATRAGGVVELKVPHKKVDPRDVERRDRERRDGVGAGAACQDTAVMPTAGNLAVIEAATLCLLNGERIDAGMAPLQTNALLARSSLGHTNDMVANLYFAHAGLNGSDVVSRVRATGYIVDDAAWTVGENLAWGTGTLATPAGIVNAWMNSPGHRANILNAEFREIGFGIAIGNPRANDGQGATYTTNFGAINGTAADDTSQAAAEPTDNVAGTRTTSTAAERRAAAKRRALARCKAAARRKNKKLSARKAAARCRRAAAARRR